MKHAYTHTWRSSTVLHLRSAQRPEKEVPARARLLPTFPPTNVPKRQRGTGLVQVLVLHERRVGLLQAPEPPPGAKVAAVIEGGFTSDGMVMELIELVRSLSYLRCAIVRWIVRCANPVIKCILGDPWGSAILLGGTRVCFR